MCLLFLKSLKLIKKLCKFELGILSKLHSTKIAHYKLQTKVLYIVFGIFLVNSFHQKGITQENRSKFNTLPVDIKRDTSKLKITNDTILPKKNSKKNNQKLTDLAYRDAKGYEKLDQKNKQITLYDEAIFKYLEYELKAGIIVYDYEKEELYAGRIKDSLGNLSQRPIFKQGSQIVEPDSIRFNMKSKKAIIWNTRTQYNEFNIKAEKTKRVNDSVYYMKNVRFTTSEDIENPEYYFQTDKVKFVPGQKVVTGVTNMVIANVPTPLGLPFAFFPMTTKSVSGFIFPSFGDTNQRGYYIQNGGYYFAIGEKMDLTLLADYYTNGSYAFNAQSRYAERYKYNGNFNVRFENLIQSEIGFPDYSKSRIYNIQWSHSQDQKANPTSRFSASVNLGSSTYFRNSMNQQNIGANMNNTMSSSISYSKTFETVPQINYTVSANHSQNTNTQQINMSLPNLQASVDRIYPFAPKNGSKRGFIQNINLQYNVRGENRIQTTDSLFFKTEMFKSMNSGFQHTIPLATNFKLFRYFSVTMSGNYTESWVFNTIRRSFNENENRVMDERINGFDAFRQYNFSSNIGTTLYGTYYFKKGSKLEALRHVIRPSASYMYTPSFDQYYDTYAIDANGTTMEEYTRFQGGLWGAPNQNMSNMMSFSVGNNLEAKVRDDESSTGESKKVMILNSLNFGTSYNMSSDSLKLAPVRVSGNTMLLKNKLNLNFGTSLDPYAINNEGQRIDKMNIKNGGSLFRMTSANLTLNYSLSSDDPLFGGNKGKENSEDQNVMNGGRADDLFGKSLDLADRRKSMFDKEDDEDEVPTSLYSSKIPWDITFAYSMTYNNANRDPRISNNSLMFSGNVTLTPSWRFGFSSGYDFVNKGVTYTQLRFERDLKSWRMDFSWIPNGYYKQWTFFIGIKSSVLQDIKYEKRNTADRIYR